MAGMSTLKALYFIEEIEAPTKSQEQLITISTSRSSFHKMQYYAQTKDLSSRRRGLYALAQTKLLISQF